MQVMQLYIVCLKQRAVSLMEVHVFTEYQGSTEQDYGKIAKGCEEESTIKYDTHQRRGHNKCIRLSATLMRQIYQARRRVLVRGTTKQRVIPMISEELRERECHVVNEQVW